MKRSLSLLLSFALLAAVSCSEEKTETSAPPPPVERIVKSAIPAPEEPTKLEEAPATVEVEEEAAPPEAVSSASEAGESTVPAPKANVDPARIAGDLGSRRLIGDGTLGTGKGGIGGVGLGRTVSPSKGGGGVGFGRLSPSNWTGGSGARNVPRESLRPIRNTEGYVNHGTNPFTDPLEDRLSTFAIDVDTGSYTIARRKLNGGRIPPADSVRVEEFVNYFDYDYAEPKSGAFAVSMEAAPSPFATTNDTYLLRVGVQGKTIAPKDRKPVHLTFLVDVSGSMRSADKIGLVKKALRVLADNLREEDTVAIATYAGATQILLRPTKAAERTLIFDAIEKLTAGGSTAMASGLTLAYQLADENLQPTHENRVIVLSDGDANVGRTSPKELSDQIAAHVKHGITLSTIGFGMGNYKDHRMEQLANDGNGNYYYVDSEREARKIFGDQLDGTLQVIARDVKLQVEFNPEAVERYRLIGYENRDIADKDFRNDAVDAGEIGAGHTVTAMYEVVLKDELPERIATVRVRHKEPRGSEEAAEAKFGLDRGDLRAKIADSSVDFQFAASVCAFAEKLRGSEYAKQITWDWIEEIAASAAGNRGDRKEMVELVRKARRNS